MPGAAQHDCEGCSDCKLLLRIWALTPTSRSATFTRHWRFGRVRFGNIGISARVGEWNGSLPGCNTFVAWSPAGSTASTPSSAWCAWVACKSCWDIC